MNEPAQPANRKRQGGATKFKPGVSGNPKGRPAAMFSFGKYLRDFLASEHPQAEEYNLKTGNKDKVRSQLDVIVRRLAKDDPKILLQYGFGKPIETHEISGVDGAPMVILKHAHELIK
jgi:hypothetical protein